MKKYLLHPIFKGIRLFFYSLFFIYFYVYPSKEIFTGHTICIFYNILHRPCPGCGMTRAFYLMLHGDIKSALQYNVLVLVVFPLLIYLMVNDIFVLILGCSSGEKYRLSLVEKLLLKIYDK